jgi:hypothetical protein
MRWRWPERQGSTLLKLALLALLAAAAFDGTHRAVAQDEPPTADEPAPPQEEPVDRTGRPPFTLYPTEPGAIPFDALSPADQEIVMRQAEMADLNSGPDVTAAWSTYTRHAAAEAKVKRAAYQAGMTGFENVGVEP